MEELDVRNHPSVIRVAEVLKEKGISGKIIVLKDSAMTAAKVMIVGTE